jgi:hypothetical protein
MIVGKGHSPLSLLRLRHVRRAAAVLALLFVAIQFVRPDLTNPPVVADLTAPPEVQRVLRHSCYNCHSNETQVPWFDRIVPAYWKVVEDVRLGREHLNFSSFGTLPAAQQKGLLYESVNQIRLGAMPPSAYTLVHPGSVVAPSDVALLERYLHPEAEEQEVAPALPVPALPMFPSRADVPPAPDGLAFVQGYEDWQAVAATDRFDNGTVRVILANDVAIRALQDSRLSPWPDGTTFAKVAWNAAADTTGVVHAGSFRQVEFMVKDAAKYASTEGWGWGRWLGADLKPYGDSSVFTRECTSCHAPIHRNDYVFTMPIRSATSRADLLNTEALPADDFSQHPLEWRVISLFVDKRAATLSIVYGNAPAVEHARDGSPNPYPVGAALARLTWSEREDPHWFGARMPGRVLSSRLITVGGTADGQPTYDCQEQRGGAPQHAASAPCAPDPIGSLLSEATSAAAL